MFFTSLVFVLLDFASSTNINVTKHGFSHIFLIILAMDFYAKLKTVVKTPAILNIFYSLSLFVFSGATTDNLPPGVLYRVKATYKYTREDVDELSFDVGEIIRVVEYDDPEEQV